MEANGRHLLIEYHECDRAILNDAARIEEAMKNAALAAQTTIVTSVFHRFSPQGVSGVVVVEESHLSIHTWPEHGYAAVDFFTCGDTVDPYKAYEYLKDCLESQSAHLTDLKRGLPSATDEIIDHKPVWRPTGAQTAG